MRTDMPPPLVFIFAQRQAKLTVREKERHVELSSLLDAKRGCRVGSDLFCRPERLESFCRLLGEINKAFHAALHGAGKIKPPAQYK
ncbi:hypothetical protein BaRGS_00009337 [Batillaria attramentaria]|uniref:Uncharacterized protein n=1 Tax=Batillaria attramentaria TaxID=370345 RepID=A0ABD0LK52_9CAEN